MIILIKGMGMPKKGEYKPLFIYDTGEVTMEIRGEEVQVATAIPAADVRPVVRGFNVDKDYPSLFECSVCGWADHDTTTGDTRTYNFCPNWGADMREES